MHVSLPCLRDCLVFLCRGAISIKGQEAITEAGYAYAVKNEEWLALGENTTIVVMEQGRMRGACNRAEDRERRAARAREKRASQESVGEQVSRAVMEEARRNKPWYKLLRKLRREPEPEPEVVQCPTQ